MSGLVGLVVFFGLLGVWAIIIEPAASRWDWLDGWAEFGREWWANPVWCSVALMLMVGGPAFGIWVLVMLLQRLGGGCCCER